MNSVSTLLKKFSRDQSGLETVEYAVMAALITGAAMLAITALGGAVATAFSNLTALISGN